MATSSSPSLAVLRAVRPRWHKAKPMSATKKTQYLCAVVLIITSIAMVAYQVFTIQDVANGLLVYVAQAFLLAGSIFGLDYYIDKITHVISYNSNK